jgi:hypothetical protein
MKVKIWKADGELVIALPLDAVTELKWELGDVLEGRLEGDGVKLVRVETQHDRAMRIADKVMDDYRETMEALAKS